MEYKKHWDNKSSNEHDTSGKTIIPLKNDTADSIQCDVKQWQFGLFTVWPLKNNILHTSPYKCVKRKSCQDTQFLLALISSIHKLLCTLLNQWCLPANRTEGLEHYLISYPRRKLPGQSDSLMLHLILSMQSCLNEPITLILFNLKCNEYKISYLVTNVLNIFFLKFIKSYTSLLKCWLRTKNEFKTGITQIWKLKYILFAWGSDDLFYINNKL